MDQTDFHRRAIMVGNSEGVGQDFVDGVDVSVCLGAHEHRDIVWSPLMGIGTLHCVVLDVGDLELAERFWSEVTGLEVIGSNYAERFSWLGTPDPWHAEMILQARSSTKGTETNRCHVDITPKVGVDEAIDAIVAIGGNIKKTPSIYPRPGSLPGRRPLIDWAVMRDPFGNEFCLVDNLTSDQSEAVLAAAAAGAVDDHAFRVAAGVTS